MDCRCPYGRSATVDKNRETASSQNQAIAGDARKRASGTARLLHELYRMRVTTKNPMIGIARKIRIARSRKSWPAPELWSVSCHDRIMTSTI
jgi:hypothetical protein